ncbi:MAG TPA: basic amino acid ABC transporter substrate-binding protein [Spirochaetia bacterium]|nr:basic amino acid ABC transporter substrate-binding protein [Spirochaetia bacterium]
MKKIIWLVVLVVAILPGAMVFGQSGPTITVATDATWPPMEFVNTNKQIVGFDIDLLNAAAAAAGFQVKFQDTAWDGIFAGLGNGDYDAVISSVTITDERKKVMDFSMPYLNAGQVLVVQSGVTGVSTLADMKGKSVGAQIGTTGAMAIDKVPGVKLNTYDEIGLAIEDLANGRIAGVVVDSPTAANYVLQNDNYKGRLKIIGKPFTTEYYGVAVNKGNSRVLNMNNQGLQIVLNNGTEQALEAKWLR